MIKKIAATLLFIGALGRALTVNAFFLSAAIDRRNQIAPSINEDPYADHPPMPGAENSESSDDAMRVMLLKPQPKPKVFLPPGALPKPQPTPKPTPKPKPVPGVPGQATPVPTPKPTPPITNPTRP
ncbi:MAG: hypothetical protein WCF18_16625 [Chthoniobacteraceae bacterium]